MCARFGFETGREATAEALTYAWENWERVRRMHNPAGYVYKTGWRIGRRLRNRRQPIDFSPPEGSEHHFEPGLGPALEALSPRQRAVVVMVHALGWTQKETAELLGVSTSSVQRHLDRAMVKLRRALGVDVGS